MYVEEFIGEMAWYPAVPARLAGWDLDWCLASGLPASSFWAMLEASGALLLVGHRDMQGRTPLQPAHPLLCWLRSHCPKQVM